MATLDQVFRIDNIPATLARFRASEFIATGGGMAAKAAALKCTRFGGRVGIPTRAETDAKVLA